MSSVPTATDLPLGTTQPGGISFCHVSDIHINTRKNPWGLKSLFSKSLTGWINLKLLGRGRQFKHTEKIIPAMRADIALQKTDCLVFSGDASALGFEDEIREASELLGAPNPAFLPGIAVPGNHDVHALHSSASGHFEKYFSHWQQGIRIDQHIYPFARKIGPAWFIGVNSATPNFLPWDARGLVGQGQLDRLKTLLSMLDPGPRILVTHYPIRLADEKSERRHRLLRDLEPLVNIANQGGISLWLHGHRHNHYFLPPAEGRLFPTLCAGSCTQTNHWSYSRVAISNNIVSVEQRIFDPETGSFRSHAIHNQALKANPSIFDK